MVCVSSLIWMVTSTEIQTNIPHCFLSQRVANTITSINLNLLFMCYWHYSGKLNAWPVFLLAKAEEKLRLQKASHGQCSLFCWCAFHWEWAAVDFIIHSLRVLFHPNRHGIFFKSCWPTACQGHVRPLQLLKREHPITSIRNNWNHCLHCFQYNLKSHGWALLLLDSSLCITRAYCNTQTFGYA